MNKFRNLGPIKYSIDEDFFEKINTEEKAYFLGILYADGYVDPKRRLIGITLQEQDKELLEKLRKVINYNKPLKLKTSKQLNRKKVYILDIYRSKMYYDVVNLGCIPAKSLILRFPNQNQVPGHLLRHFVRGYFDGDGHISEHISIVSTKYFIGTLREILNSIGIESKVYNMKCNDITKSMPLYKNASILKFCEWIYKDANIFMLRKYNKYLELKNKLK